MELSAGFNANSEPVWNILISETENNCVQVVKVLIDQGHDVNTQDDKGNTPLRLAVSNGSMVLFKLLMDADADVNLGNKHGWTPLITAAFTGNSEIVKSLLAAGAQVNRMDGGGRSALSWAAVYGRQEVVETLLEEDADVETRNHNGDTPLSLAARDGHAGVVQKLLEAGTDLGAILEHDNCPLCFAITNGHGGVARLLLRHQVLCTPAIPQCIAGKQQLRQFWNACKIQTDAMRQMRIPKLRITWFTFAQEKLVNRLAEYVRILDVESWKELQESIIEQHFPDFIELLSEQFKKGHKRNVLYTSNIIATHDSDLRALPEDLRRHIFKMLRDKELENLIPSAVESGCKSFQQL